jgi:hypothetical protein
MVRISTAAGRPLACHFTQFGFVIARALLFNASHPASVAKLSALSIGLSAGSCASALSARQGKQMLACEIRRSQQQIKPSPANKSPKSENSVGRLLRGISVANTMFATDGAEKNIGPAKLNFLLAT